MQEKHSTVKRKVHSLTTVTVVSYLIILVILKYAFGEHFGITETLISAAILGIAFFLANYWRLKKEQKKLGATE